MTDDVERRRAGRSPVTDDVERRRAPAGEADARVAPADVRSAPLVRRDVLRAPADEVAPRLLGLHLVAGPVVARIVEVEAYREDDPACHAHRGRTPSNATLFGEAGKLYVYRSYGIHHCGNVVAGAEGEGAGCLVRAVAVQAGHDVASRRRAGRDGTPRALAGGPGKVGQVLALDSDRDDGLDLLDPDSRVTLHDTGSQLAAEDVVSGPRVGVTEAPDVPWRFWLAGHPAVSRYSRSPRAARSAGRAGQERPR